MINLKYIFILLFLFFSGCSKNEPPAYNDVKNIIINNNKISAADYYEKYCTKVSPEISNHVRCTTAKQERRSEKVIKSLDIDRKIEELNKLNDKMGIK